MSSRRSSAAAPGSRGCGYWARGRAARAAAPGPWPSWSSRPPPTPPQRCSACKARCCLARKGPSSLSTLDIRWHTTDGFSHMKEPKTEKRANSINSFVALGT